MSANAIVVTLETERQAANWKVKRFYIEKEKMFMGAQAVTRTLLYGKQVR